MYDVNLTFCSKTDPVIPYFLSVFLLKSFQLAFHFSSVVTPLRYKRVLLERVPAFPTIKLIKVYTFRILGRRSYESHQERPYLDRLLKS